MVTRRDQGFTLVELLVVVLILGVLSGMTVMAVSGARRTSVVQACTTDWQTLANALTTYGNDHLTASSGSPDFAAIATDPVAGLISGPVRYLSSPTTAAPTSYRQVPTIVSGGTDFSIRITSGDGSHATDLGSGATSTAAATACDAAVA